MGWKSGGANRAHHCGQIELRIGMRYSTGTVGVLILIFLTQNLASQTSEQIRSLIEQKGTDRSGTSSPAVPSLAFEETVNSAEYVVGPSDILSVNIWTSPAINYSLAVTPEGTLIVPTVGEVVVSGMTLEAVKTKIIAEIGKKYVVAASTVTLLMPREIVVAVGGEVRSPGKYVLRATDRADKAIDKANELKMSHEQDVPPNASKRNIMLVRGNGERVRIDLPKYAYSRDVMVSPLLREGDQILVPRKSRGEDVFAIYGGVNFPGQFEYTGVDSLKDVFALGRGFRHNAIVDSIEFYRYDLSVGRLAKTVFSYSDLVGEKIPNRIIEVGDRIVVKVRPDERKDYVAIISGEVMFPGTYPISREKTKLRTLIERAGGFSQFASLKTAYVLRRSLEPEEIQLEKLLNLRGGITPEDSANYILESELRIRREVVNVNFEGLFLRNDSTQDIVLRDRDEIVIPSTQKTVYVFGQVASPGNVSFVQGQSVDEYIRQAGGFTAKARTGDVMIIKRATRQWLEPKESKIEEGDYVWVPKEIEHTFSWYMSVISQTATIITAAVSVALLANQLGK